ncbi:MAG: leucine--tRNA ligase [Candidatus Saccharimonadales bacterium]
MKRYNPADIEPKWQSIWEEQARYIAPDNDSKPKMYVSGMFPYPSGSGLHSGHAFSYTIVDAIARFYRPHGYNVLNPMGWDTFGLPAENYAIKTGMAPSVVTKQNIANFKNQFKRMGVSVDWSREINTSDPEYYRWTQWIFTQFFNKGLAYQKESMQWWCPVDKTVLANEQVEGGKCWRCGSEVEKKSMKQWFFKITDYADSLLEEIPNLDWPDKIKTAQTNWIGKSEGAEIDFILADESERIRVFTTRPDTLFGATFLVVAPEHPLARSLVNDDTREAVDSYITASLKRSDIERMAESKEKTGVFSGSYAINPATGSKIPIWIADYVLGGYGTGAIMAVPAHDERDFAFAEKFKLPIIKVVEAPSRDEQIYHGEGTLLSSGEFDGMATSEAREQIVNWLEAQGVGAIKTTYKMRDWLISRQRYWGAPIPIIHCPEHGAVAVPEAELPVKLPNVEDYAPKGDGKSVLASVEDWVHVDCPTCGGPALRETDTMDGYACSSWYLLRYADPKNETAAWDPAIANYWSPVDYYVGGDHAVAHLLYVRFWAHVFKDMGLINHREPVKKLVYHGYVNAEDGRKMSKSLGNVIDPLDIIDQGYGADTLRTYVLFMGPIELDLAWSSQGVGGVHRFLNRVWTLTQEYLASDVAPNNDIAASMEQIRHRTIKKVTNDYRELSFNTATAALMEYVNELYKAKTNGFTTAWRLQLETLVQLLSPLAPHVSAELWEQLGNDQPLDIAMWPHWDDSQIKTDTITLAVQVNGKLRATLELPADVTKEAAIEAALASENVARHVAETGPKKTIYVPGRLINIVS